jgi:hypothetical protein
VSAEDGDERRIIIDGQALEATALAMSAVAPALPCCSCRQSRSPGTIGLRDKQQR